MWYGDREREFVRQTMIEYHYLDVTGQLSPFKNILHKYVTEAIAAIDPRLDICADLCLSHDPLNCNPELGIGGVAFSQSLMHIFLDANNPNLEQSIREEVLAVLAHESHHCVRIQKVPDHVTLMDNIVTEGLACHFETEITGCSAPSFIPDEVLNASREHLRSMRASLEDTEFCFETYFLGKDLKKYPKYAGFAVGFELVGQYLAKVKSTASEAVYVPASDVLAII